MATSPWAALVGGVGNFVTNQRTLKEEDASRAREAEKHALFKTLTDVQTKTAQEELDSRPGQRAREQGDYEFRVFRSLTPQSRANMLAGITDPTQRAATEAQFAQMDARVKEEDAGRANQTRYYGTQADAAAAELPITQGKRDIFLESRQYLKDHPNANGQTDPVALRHYTNTGQQVALTPDQIQKNRMAEIRLQNQGAIDAAIARGNQEREFRKDTLLPGTNPSTDNMVRGSLLSFEKMADAAADEITMLDKVNASQIRYWYQQKGRRAKNDPELKAFIARMREERKAKVDRILKTSTGPANVATSMKLMDEGLHTYIQSQVQGAMARLPIEPEMYNNPDVVAPAAGSGGSVDADGKKDFGAGFGGQD